MRRAAATNTEGVGESRSPSPAADVSAGGEARNLSAPRFISLRPAALRSMKLEPLSRRRPLSSTEPAYRRRLRCADRTSIHAGPFDAVIDIVRSRRPLGGVRTTSSSCVWLSPFSPSLFSSSPCCPPVMS